MTLQSLAEVSEHSGGAALSIGRLVGDFRYDTLLAALDTHRP
jgi:hypothetical protein